MADVIKKLFRKREEKKEKRDLWLDFSQGQAKGKFYLWDVQRSFMAGPEVWPISSRQSSIPSWNFLHYLFVSNAPVFHVLRLVFIAVCLCGSVCVSVLHTWDVAVLYLTACHTPYRYINRYLNEEHRVVRTHFFFKDERSVQVVIMRRNLVNSMKCKYCDCSFSKHTISVLLTLEYVGTYIPYVQYVFVKVNTIALYNSSDLDFNFVCAASFPVFLNFFSSRCRFRRPVFASVFCERTL